MRVIKVLATLLAMVATVGSWVAASAGEVSETSDVLIFASPHGAQGATKAIGQIRDVRNAPGRLGFIECEVRGRSTNVVVICGAKDSAGTTLGCQTRTEAQATHMARALALIGPDSSLEFVTDVAAGSTGDCLSVSVGAFSKFVR